MPTHLTERFNRPARSVSDAQKLIGDYSARAFRSEQGLNKYRHGRTISMLGVFGVGNAERALIEVSRNKGIDAVAYHILTPGTDEGCSPDSCMGITVVPKHSIAQLPGLRQPGPQDRYAIAASYGRVPVDANQLGDRALYNYWLQGMHYAANACISQDPSYRPEDQPKGYEDVNKAARDDVAAALGVHTLLLPGVVHMATHVYGYEPDERHALSESA